MTDPLDATERAWIIWTSGGENRVKTSIDQIRQAEIEATKKALEQVAQWHEDQAPECGAHVHHNTTARKLQKFHRAAAFSIRAMNAPPAVPT